MRRSVLVIYTGGTIGMVEDPATGALVPFDFAALKKHVPELERLDLEVESIAFDTPIDSSDIEIHQWQALAGVIEANYEKHNGFVVLHGTDTMAFSASALSFMLEGLNKPVVFTGSQLPIDTVRTDGRENLVTAVQIAGMERNGEPCLQEVAIYFGSQLLRGNRTHKYSSEDFYAFRSPNYSPLAEVGIHIDLNTVRMLKPKGTFKVYDQMENNIAVLKLFPGITKEVVQQICGAKNIKGLLVETFGSGNAPTKEWFLNEIQHVIQRGVTVVNVTQCNDGFVEQGRYASSRGFAAMGVLSAADMTFEAALTKLMHVLSYCKDEDAIAKGFLEDKRGELTTFSSLV
ncbi:MAG: asparaginase [Flavobacteriales bacterium]|nr:asparaginase [Flavobacteriales bacterium]